MGGCDWTPAPAILAQATAEPLAAAVLAQLSKRQPAPQLLHSRYQSLFQPEKKYFISDHWHTLHSLNIAISPSFVDTCRTHARKREGEWRGRHGVQPWKGLESAGMLCDCTSPGAIILLMLAILFICTNSKALCSNRHIYSLCLIFTFILDLQAV